MKIKCTFLFTLVLFFSSQAQSFKVTAVGANIGSLGAGLHVKSELGEKLNLRLSANYMQMKFNKTYKSGPVDVDRTRTFRVGGIALYSDWRLSDSKDIVRLTAGVCYQMNQLIDYRTHLYDKNGTVEDLGTLELTVNTFPVSPYLGFTFGNFRSEKKIKCFLEVGTFYHGRPKVEFIGTGRIEPTATQDDIIRDNLKNYNFIPNLNFQINYNLK